MLVISSDAVDNNGVGIEFCAGKLNRGLSVVDSLKLLKEEPLSETDTFNACALGWCIEWV